jgi:hypothetical protein
MKTQNLAPQMSSYTNTQILAIYSPSTAWSR